MFRLPGAGLNLNGFKRPMSSKSTVNSDFHIVGVGASAGGLEAIEKLFKEMPEDTGAAFVVVQHLSPDFKSHMSELLARKTDLAIKSIENDMPVEPNTIYLIPPNTEMMISDPFVLWPTTVATWQLV